MLWAYSVSSVNSVRDILFLSPAPQSRLRARRTQRREKQDWGKGQRNKVWGKGQAYAIAALVSTVNFNPIASSNVLRLES